MCKFVTVDRKIRWFRSLVQTEGPGGKGVNGESTRVNRKIVNREGREGTLMVNRQGLIGDSSIVEGVKSPRSQATARQELRRGRLE